MNADTTPSSVVDSDGHTVAIVGSRSFPYEMWPDTALEFLSEELVDAGFPLADIVTGDASGVDAAAVAWSNTYDVPASVIEPDWEAYGDAAGPRRNSTIVEEADRVVALWNGTSPGTRDTVGKARYVLGDERIHLAGIGGNSPSLSDVDPQVP